MEIGEPQEARQADVMHAMVRSGKSLEEILEHFGISDKEYIEWIRDGTFCEEAASLARRFAEADAPYVWSALLASAKKGSVPAIRLYFDIWNKRSTGSGMDPPPELEALRDTLFGSEDEEEDE